MNIAPWLSTRAKQLFNIMLLLICSFSYVFFIRILSDKEQAVSSIRGSRDIAFAFDEYWLLDFIFGWPLIVLLIAALVWVYIRQFKAETIREKIKTNGWALLFFFVAWLGWLACLYYPATQFTPLT